MKIIFDALIYVFALYGVISLVRNFFNRTQNNIGHIRTNYKLILTVKNQEDSIEGVIRNIFRDDLFRDRDTNASVMVIDKGSTDDTVKILKKLQEVYDNLEIVQEMER